MTPPAPRLVSSTVVLLPGKVGALAVASAGKVVAAGDDRGEAGLWDVGGRRLAAWRFRAAIAWADVDTDGGRAAFVATDGEARIVRPGGHESVFLVRPGDRVLLDRAGTGAYSLSPASGDVDALDGGGRSQRRFKAPAPVAGAAAVARSGGIAAVSKEGVVARLSAWGALAWGGDWKRYAGGVASDPLGEMLVLCFLSHGAEVVQPSGGGRLGLLDLGRPVETASLSATHVALGCADGAVTLLDRSGRVLAEGRGAGRVAGVGVVDGGTVVAWHGDGSVRVWQIDGTPSVVGPAPPRSASILFRREMPRSRASRPPLHVAASPAGAWVAVAAEGRTVAVLGLSGRPVAETSHEGNVLALRVDDAGAATVATTSEIRRVAPDADVQVRRFGVDQVRAAFAPGGATLASSDEVGTVRLADAGTGQDLWSVQIGRGDSVQRIFATTAGVAFETRRGVVRTVTSGRDAEVTLVEGGRRPRLVAATREGPVLAFPGEIVACEWAGPVRWRLRPQSPTQSVAALHDGRLVLVLRGGLAIVGPDGRIGRLTPRPEGDLAAVAAATGAALAWKDGRRLTVADAAGRTLAEETFEGKVLAAAVAEGGAVAAALLDGGLAVLRCAGDEPVRDPSAADRVASGA